MKFNVDIDDLVRALELILETQQSSNDMFDNKSVFDKVSDMLDVISRLPLYCSVVELSEEEVLLLGEYFN